MLPRGLEPRTLRLLAVRSDQLSYKSQRYEPRVANSIGWENERCAKMENLGIDPSASRMLSERSTI
jgi:hypothetical protein